MAEPHAHSQPIQTYGPAPHNRNIWPSPTPTANQYKHMAEPHTIDYVTPGRFFCLLFKSPSTHYWWLTPSPCLYGLYFCRSDSMSHRSSILASWFPFRPAHFTVNPPAQRRRLDSVFGRGTRRSYD